MWQSRQVGAFARADGRHALSGPRADGGLPCHGSQSVRDSRAMGESSRDAGRHENLGREPFRELLRGGDEGLRRRW